MRNTTLVVLATLVVTPTLAWRADLGTLHDVDYVEELTLDPSGNPIAVARIDRRMTVVKLDRISGAILWTRPFPELGPSQHVTPWAHAWDTSDLETDASGNVYAVGWTNISDLPPQTLETRALAMALRGSDGAVLWSREILGGIGMSLDLDGNGGVVIGSRWSIFSGQGVVKLDATTGATLWEHPLDHYGADEIAVDSFGDVFSVGSGVLTKLDGATGSSLWSEAIPSTADHLSFELVLDSTGNAIVGGFETGVVKHDGATGALEWSHAPPNVVRIMDLAVTSSDEVIAGGLWSSQAVEAAGVVFKLSSAGGAVWSTGPQELWPLAVALDPGDDVYVTGRVDAGAGLWKFDGFTSSVDWKRVVAGTSNDNWASEPGKEWGATVVADQLGSIYAGGLVINRHEPGKYGSSHDGFVVRQAASPGTGFYAGELNPLWDNWFDWVYTYHDLGGLYALIDEELETNPALEGAVLTDDVQVLLEAPDQLVLVTPESEIEALAWMVENQGALAEREAWFHLFFLEGGEGATLLEELIESGRWMALPAVDDAAPAEGEELTLDADVLAE